MNDTAHPYGDISALIKDLTLQAGEVARSFGADVLAAKVPAEKRALNVEYDRMLRAVRLGGAWLVRLDEAALKLAKLSREDAFEARSARLKARVAAAQGAMDRFPRDERLPHLDRLIAIARDLRVPDEALDAQLDAAVAELTAAATAGAQPAAPPPAHPRSQAEIMAAALQARQRAAPRSAPPLRRSG